MRNHVRHTRRERTQPALEEGHEPGRTAPVAVRRRSGAREAVALAPAPAGFPDSELFDDPEDTDGTEPAEAAEGLEGAADTEEFEDLDELAAVADDEAADDELDVRRLTCPDCGRPITVLETAERLPEHALCPTPWDPFGLTVCAGSGRAVAEALPPVLVELPGARREGPDFGTVLALPAGLDWRTQPFSHVGGPGSRPIRVPAQPPRPHAGPLAA